MTEVLGDPSRFYSQWIQGNMHSESGRVMSSNGSNTTIPNGNVLVVSFEAMKLNLTREMCRVAKHLGLSLSDVHCEALRTFTFFVSGWRT